MARRRNRWLAVAAGLSLPLVLAAPAPADVDPASDVLLLQDVFTSQSPPPIAQRLDELRAVTAAAKKAGFPLKVAVIGSRTDLGGIPQLFGKPQQYARFLGTELNGATGRRHQPLLVVMAAGFGTFEIDPGVAGALRGVTIPQGGNDDLVKAATAAVPKLSTAAGHPVKAVPKSGGGSSSAPAWVFVIPVILLALAGLIVSQRGRRERSAADEEQP